MWEEPTRWCDAKEVFRRLRAWLQEQGLPLRIVDAEIIDAMAAVPDDVAAALPYRVEVRALGHQLDVAKVLRPVSEGAVFVQVGGMDRRGSILRVAREPMQLYQIGVKVAFRQQRSNPQQ